MSVEMWNNVAVLAIVAAAGLFVGWVLFRQPGH